MKNLIEYTAEPHTPYPNNYISRNKLKKNTQTRSWGGCGTRGTFLVGTYIPHHFREPFGDYISKDPAIIPLSVQVLKRQMSGKMYKKIHHSIQKVNGKTGSF